MASPALRIAHVTATFPPYQGGTGTVCYYNTRELARRGHDVTVFTAAMDGAPEHETLEGVHVRRLRSVARVGNAAVLPQLVPVLSPFDLIHVHLPFIAGGELTSLAAAVHRVPLVVTYHSDLVRDGTWRDLVFQAATWSSRCAVLMRADAALFVSEGHAETCDQRSVHRIRREGCRVVPNGVDTALFQPGLDREETRRCLGMSAEHPVVGFVGALDRAHHYKGLEILMTALSDGELGHVQLLVVGDGDWKEHYQRRAAALQLDSRTTFLGKVGHESLPPLYRACDILAVPSLVPESFGLVIAESFACETPALVSDGPGVRSLVEHRTSGLLVPAGDIRSLRQGLVKLLAMPDDTLKAMGQAGRRRIEACYTWQRIGCLLDRTYADVMAQTYSKNTTSCSREAK